MTTTNGGRVIEHVEGAVASSNERGVKLVGEDGYRNFSKYTTEPIAPPRRGAHVRLGLDASGFVRQLEVLDSLAEAPSSSDRDHEIRRMSALRSAATFCGGRSVSNDVSTKDVLAVAAAFLRWLEQEGGEQTT